MATFMDLTMEIPSRPLDTSSVTVEYPVHIDSLLMAVEPPKMSPHFKTPRPSARNSGRDLTGWYSSGKRQRAVMTCSQKHWLWNVDTALLFANRQMHKESVGYMFSVNAFVLPPTLVLSRPALPRISKDSPALVLSDWASSSREPARYFAFSTSVHAFGLISRHL